MEIRAVCVCCFPTQTPSGDFSTSFCFSLWWQLMSDSSSWSRSAVQLPVGLQLAVFDGGSYRALTPHLHDLWLWPYCSCVMSIKTPTACCFSSFIDCGIEVCGQQPADSPQEVDQEYISVFGCSEHLQDCQWVAGDRQIVFSAKICLWNVLQEAWNYKPI